VITSAAWSTEDSRIAAQIAAETGRLLLEVRTKHDSDELGAEGDRRAHELITKMLAELRPDDDVLSEEGVDDPARLRAERVWIVDPLDGTREYARPERPDWAVHIALWASSADTGRGDLVAGALDAPALGLAFSTGEPIVAAADPAQVRIVVSRSRRPAFMDELATEVGAEVITAGSAGVKTALVLTGQADAYVHRGGLNEWDAAAPIAVARSAGLFAGHLDGTPWRFNQPDPRGGDLLICRDDLAPLLIEAIAGLT